MVASVLPRSALALGFLAHAATSSAVTSVSAWYAVSSGTAPKTGRYNQRHSSDRVADGRSYRKQESYTQARRNWSMSYMDFGCFSKLFCCCDLDFVDRFNVDSKSDAYNLVLIDRSAAGAGWTQDHNYGGTETHHRSWQNDDVHTRAAGGTRTSSWNYTGYTTRTNSSTSYVPYWYKNENPGRISTASVCCGGGPAEGADYEIAKVSSVNGTSGSSFRVGYDKLNTAEIEELKEDVDKALCVAGTCCGILSALTAGLMTLFGVSVERQHSYYGDEWSATTALSFVGWTGMLAWTLAGPCTALMTLNATKNVIENEKCHGSDEKGGAGGRVPSQAEGGSVASQAVGGSSRKNWSRRATSGSHSGSSEGGGKEEQQTPLFWAACIGGGLLALVVCCCVMCRSKKSDDSKWQQQGSTMETHHTPQGGQQTQKFDVSDWGATNAPAPGFPRGHNYNAPPPFQGQNQFQQQEQQQQQQRALHQAGFPQHSPQSAFVIAQQPANAQVLHQDYGSTCVTPAQIHCHVSPLGEPQGLPQGFGVLGGSPRG